MNWFRNSRSSVLRKSWSSGFRSTDHSFQHRRSTAVAIRTSTRVRETRHTISGSVTGEALRFHNDFRRHYYVDRNNVRHFRQRGAGSWFGNPRTVFAVVSMCSVTLITVYYSNLETIPYSRRKHFVILSTSAEKKIGEAEFHRLTRELKGKILPAGHPESVRVRMIARNIIDALKRGLGKDISRRDPVSDVDEHRTFSAFGSEEKWREEGDVLNDSRVREWRTEGKERGSQPNTKLLDDWNWEIIVVNDPQINAMCIPGGKIILHAGLLQIFGTETEIATVIGHEIAHAVARHTAEEVTKNLLYAVLLLVMYMFFLPDLVDTTSTLFLKLPYSRRMETEADYIGLLLVASAGYDPRVVPSFYEKMGKLTKGSAMEDYVSTHPSGQKRAKLLAQAKVMDEAISIWKEARSSHQVQGFLL